MSAASPQVAPPAARFRAARNVLSENPAVALTFIFVALFVVTDIVNRAQSGKAFLTPTQVSTTFLYAAPLALLAAGQTLVMLTGGVDLSVATTATTAAFVTSGTAHDQGTAAALLLALGFGFGIGLVNGIGVAIFRVNPLIMTLGISSVTLGALTIYSQKRFVALVPNVVNTLGSSRFLRYVPYDLLVWAPIAAAFVVTLVKTMLILKGVDQNWAQVIQGSLIIVVVMIGGLAIRQRRRA